MRWALGILAVVGLAAVTLTPGTARLSVDERAVEIASLPCNRGLQSTSSGFLIDDRTVVTVAHALYESQDHAVLDAAGTWHRATIRAFDLERDLAILDVGALRATPFETARARSEQSVALVGGAASGTVAGTVVRRVRMTTDIIGGDDTSERSGYELSLEIEPGDSGGAVVDEQDRLVAVIFARSTRNQNRSWATAASEIALTGRQSLPVWDCPLAGVTELDLATPEADDPSEDAVRSREPERLAG